MTPPQTGRAVRYSVIVPAYNAEAIIGACLTALLGQSVPRDSYEIIVVDDGSTDSTVAVAASFGVSVISQSHAGPAAARNAGARAAQGAFLLFTDADCEPIPTWIRSIVAPLEAAAEVGGVRGAYRTRQSGLVARFTQVELEEKLAWQQRYHTIDLLDTSAAAFRRDVFDAVGGFDDAVPDASVEDTLLSFRLAEQGRRLVLAPDAIVFHRHATTLSTYLLRKWRHGYRRVHVYQQHLQKVLGDTYTPPSLQLQFAALTAMLTLLPFARVRRAGYVAVLVFLATTVPFVRRAATAGWDVALATPPLLLLRSLALGAGLGCGLVRSLFEMLRRRGSRP